MRGRDACGACRENARKQCMQGVQGMCVKGMRAEHAGKMRIRGKCAECAGNVREIKAYTVLYMRSHCGIISEGMLGRYRHEGDRKYLVCGRK